MQCSRTADFGASLLTALNSYVTMIARCGLRPQINPPIASSICHDIVIDLPEDG
jgi:hypothetical protein